ncbi:hypothetical protein CANTEDRAFT_100831 [Yamadazyma tenuis ATCC 10573]|uniref:6-O-methylguanine-DNA methyltransferase n=1 Tax=Candida tenuis (strain ATCC 10573 / BCRC 21748 / CBS 615 / JCM 9827 / NBRC 10315 / NRRL Y-1498 / VKM Y-70) TaxID=590646 RepID=G3AWU5_CANTC|nr:uncharacterized protein CANTEDRAFT_100831 [Yamadazyma tenuis ATCC 10573]EGV66843.1 hypothetical protein CANTEDRAFT_100831 [Yamadazyma tenuis ATCC 10573]
MKLTDESKAFHYAVYAVVNQIPFGCATSYGHIAYLIGRPQNSRLVGASLKHCHEIVRQLNLQSSENDLIDIDRLPWWRVISASGIISPRGNTAGEILQKNLLTQEGIIVEGTKVSLDENGWFPDDVDL